MLLGSGLLLPLGLGLTFGLVEGLRSLLTGEQPFAHGAPSRGLLEPLLLVAIGGLMGPLLMVNGVTPLLDLCGAERTLEGPLRLRHRTSRGRSFTELEVAGVAIEVPRHVAARLEEEDVVKLRCGRFHRELKELHRRGR